MICSLREYWQEMDEAYVYNLNIIPVIQTMQNELIYKFRIRQAPYLYLGDRLEANIAF